MEANELCGNSWLSKTTFQLDLSDTLLAKIFKNYLTVIFFFSLKNIHDQ